MVKNKTIYGLKVRPDDNSNWSETGYFKSKIKRDNTASVNRIIAGFRTHSTEEKKTTEEIAQMDFDD